ncbi:hypothetical protein L227DRAFT_578872 [Lentinus tigrinus ALCF2SS1-6]|uniref:Uncharacterized protein n=1 Tax=Lentinus tigrinus ALCF2SS1-6 TaxID=1328759 RepID=A0A5C2RZA9_9APHY|nr:hypothetical protein L227DRAFT_578872 [Lentinus tigrinus ALCF2SS1-6]
MSGARRPQQRGSRDLYSWLRASTTGLTPKEAIDKTSELLRIPNLSRRSGLRRVHRRFPELAQQLNEIFDAAQARHNMHLVDAIVNIWVKLCPDAILCHELLESGVLSKMMKILSGPVDVPRTFVSLSLISQYGDDTIKAQILRGASQLVYAMSIWRYPDVIEHPIVTLAHSMELLFFEERSERGILSQIPFPSILSTTTDLLLAPPPPSPRTITHALPILLFGAQVFTMVPSRQNEAIPILEMVAVLIRSPDVALRCVAMWLFSHLYPEEGLNPSEHNPRPYQRIPITEDHETREYVQMEASSQRFVVGVWGLLESKDLLEFGEFMARTIREARYLYVDGFAPSQRDFKNAGLPFKTWEEALPVAAALLRQEGELDDADDLELEYLMITDSPKAASHAQEVMARNPQHVHAHFVFVSTSQDREANLQVAKRGAELENASPYWRRQLLVTLTELYGLKAWNLLLSSSPSDWRRRKIAEEYLEAQLKYAEIFVSVAPPDSRDLPRIIDCYVTCMLVLRGPQLSEDLAEIKPLLQLLERSQTELKKLDYPVGETHTTKGHKSLVQHFRTGIKKLSNFVEALRAHDDVRTARIPPDAARWTPSSDDESSRWADWMDGVTASSLGSLITNGPLQCGCGGSDDTPRVEINTYKCSVALYRCSRCSQITALVKQCGGCHGTATNPVRANIGLNTETNAWKIQTNAR